MSNTLIFCVERDCSIAVLLSFDDGAQESPRRQVQAVVTGAELPADAMAIQLRAGGHRVDGSTPLAVGAGALTNAIAAAIR